MTQPVTQPDDGLAGKLRPGATGAHAEPAVIASTERQPNPTRSRSGRGPQSRWNSDPASTSNDPAKAMAMAKTNVQSVQPPPVASLQGGRDAPTTRMPVVARGVDQMTGERVPVRAPQPRTEQRKQRPKETQDQDPTTWVSHCDPMTGERVPVRAPQPRTEQHKQRPRDGQCQQDPTAWLNASEIPPLTEMPPTTAAPVSNRARRKTKWETESKPREGLPPTDAPLVSPSTDISNPTSAEVARVPRKFEITAGRVGKRRRTQAVETFAAPHSETTPAGIRPAPDAGSMLALLKSKGVQVPVREDNAALAGWYGNFDIVFALFSRVSQLYPPHPPPHVRCDAQYELLYYT